MLTYFITTTLTTIGLGDLRPVSNFERLIGSMLMLIGVAVFSIIFSRATASLSKIQQITSPQNDLRRQLEMFFGVIRRFNSNIHIDAKIRNEIQGFFEYSWNTNPTQALN